MKVRLIFLYVTVITTFLTSYFYKKKLLLNLTMPYKFITPYFIYTNVYELFYTSFFICEWLSNQIFYLYLLYHATLFLVPTLNIKQYLKISKNIFYFVKINLTTLLLTYNIVFPETLHFFYNFQNSSSSVSSINLFLETKILELINFFFQIHLSLTVFMSLIYLFVLTGATNYKYNGYLRKYFYLNILLAIIAILSLNLTISLKFLIYILFVFEFSCMMTTLFQYFKISKEAN